MNVSYFQYEGVEGNYFRCDRYGTLSVRACAQNFAAAPQASRAGRLTGCIGCQVGQQHSGGQVVRNPASFLHFCSRCLKSPAQFRGDGMGRMRLVNGGLCVSCFNREREVIKGADAKGAKPRMWAERLAPRTSGVVVGGAVRAVRQPLAVGALEVGLRAMRGDPSVSAMCWVSVGFMPAVRVEQLPLIDAPGGALTRLRHAPLRTPSVSVKQFDLFEVSA